MQKEHRIEKWVKDNGKEILGGVCASLLVFILTPVADLIFTIKVELFAFVSGFFITQIFFYNLRVKKIRSVIKEDQKLLGEAKKHGKVIFVFERNILFRYHTTYLGASFKNLHDANVNMTFYDYEDLLKDFISALDESHKKKISIKGTCLILPNNFKRDDPYPKMWEKVCRQLYKFDCEFVRILCDHNKQNLINSIRYYKKNFESFCAWNKKIKFDLYIYKDPYDELRNHKKLPFNDFLIYNDKLVIGGEVLEQEKIAAPGVTKNIKVGINFSDADRYGQLFQEIKADAKLCRRVNLKSKHLIREVLDFLKT